MFGITESVNRNGNKNESPAGTSAPENQLKTNQHNPGTENSPEHTTQTRQTQNRLPETKSPGLSRFVPGHLPLHPVNAGSRNAEFGKDLAGKCHVFAMERPEGQEHGRIHQG